MIGLRFRTPTLALLLGGLLASAAPAADPATAELLRPAIGDFTGLLRHFQDTELSVDSPETAWLRERASSGDDTARALLLALLGEEGGAPEPTTPLLAEVARGWDARRRSFSAGRSGDTTGSEALWAEAGAAGERARGISPESPEAFFLSLALQDDENLSLQTIEENRRIARRLLADAAASPAVRAAACEALDDSSWERRGATPTRSEILDGYRAALTPVQGWILPRRRDVEHVLIHHLVQDRYASRRAPEQDVEEGRRRLRRLLEEFPEDQRARSTLAMSLATEGDRTEVSRLIAEAPDGQLTWLQTRLETARAHQRGEVRVLQDGDSLVVRIPVAPDWAGPAWLAGDFDGWSGTSHHAVREGDEFVARLRLGPGRYRYTLVGLGSRRDDFLGAPAVCDGSPCFVVGADGVLEPPDLEDPALRRQRALALAGAPTHALASEEALAALTLAPRSLEALGAVLRVYRSAQLSGELLADLDARKGTPAWTPEGRRYLAAHLDRERQETPIPLAGLTGGELHLEAARKGDPEALVRAARGGARTAMIVYQKGKDGTWLNQLEKVARQGPSELLHQIARVHRWNDRVEDCHRVADRLLLLQLEEGRGAQAYRNRMRLEHSHQERQRGLDEEGRRRREVLLLDGLRAFPTSLELLSVTLEEADQWPNPTWIQAALELPEGEEETSAYRALVRGQLRKRQGDRVAAERDFLLASELVPTWAEPYHRLGCTAFEAGDQAGTAGWLRKAWEQGERDLHVRIRLAYALQQTAQGRVLLELVDGGFLEGFHDVPRRAYVRYLAAAYRQSYGGDLGKVKEDYLDALRNLNDEVDPGGNMRAAAASSLLALGSATRDPAAALAGADYLLKKPAAVATAVGLALVSLFLLLTALAVLLFLLRKRPVLRAFVIAPLVWVLVLELQILGTAAAGWWLYGQPLIWIADLKGPAGAQVILLGGTLTAPLVGLFAFWELWRQGVGSRELGIDRRPEKDDVAAGVVTWLKILVVNMTIMALFAALFKALSGTVPVPQDNMPEGMGALNGSGGAGLGVFFLLVFVAPLSEELFFRGYVYGTWKKKVGNGWAAVLSGAFFALIHLNMLLPLFVAGVFFARVYEEKKTLWAPIFAHMVMNAAALVLRG